MRAVLLLQFALLLTACGASGPPDEPAPAVDEVPPAATPQAEPSPDEERSYGARGGPSAAGPIGTSPTARDGGGPYTIVPVLYATDRNSVQSDEPGERYGAQRASEVSYGICNVSIPKDHRMGALEAPSLWKFWLLDFVENPERHVVLLSIDAFPKEQFFRKLASLVGESASGKAFVFVHGYNVSFADAARRTAQMAYDLAFDGVPMFYSWPSHARTAAYPRDEENVRWSEPHVKQFLADVLQRTTAREIVLIAHSMGNRALTGAFNELVRENPAARQRFREIILAAPDIDAQIFTRDIAPRLVGADPRPTRVTLYASRNDRALQASRTFHGYNRAGDTTDGAVLFPGIDTIDASMIDTSLVGHSHYGDSISIISDMFYLLRTELRACDRARLALIPTPAGRLCRFRP